MADLTQSERDRIFNEEKAKREEAAKAKQKRDGKIAIAVFVVAAAAVYYSYEPDRPIPPVGGPSSPAPAAPSTKPNLKLIDFKDSHQDGLYYIIGSVKSNAGKTLRYAQVSFNLYDKTGAQVGTAMANINNLEAGATWKFKALIFDPDRVATFKLGELTGF